MPLTTSTEMLLDAQKNGYAVGAFNVENMEMVQAVIAAAEELRAPVMLQTTPGTLKYASPETFCGTAAALAADASVPVALHLDHGNSVELAERALRAGYTSVMIDGSPLPFEQNVELTCRVTSLAAPAGIPVEAELGRVGGKEDDLEGEDGGYTDPEKAAEFAARTGISSLAVGIGTAHGVYRKTPRLRLSLLEEIRRKVAVPLVLHGASGLTAEDVRACIARGVCKVNFATELRIAFTEGVKGYLAEDPAVIDPKKYGAAGREKVREQVLRRMTVCGCRGRY